MADQDTDAKVLYFPLRKDVRLCAVAHPDYPLSKFVRCKRLKDHSLSVAHSDGFVEWNVRPR